jgi:putative secretion ATPase (PEP-CTERM system associated)
MYTEFFKLRVKPFELVPNPEFLYRSRSHKKALNYLRYGLQEQVGFILLTGEVGSGKTTIVRNIISEMGSDVILSMIFNTKVSNKQVLAMINEDFGLNVIGKDKITLLRNLNDFLVGIHAQQRRAVVIIDEAQNLSASALEEIRLLSNLEATNAKLLQIVLVGQPELKKTIAHHKLRQLRQRISVHSQLDPLTRVETEDYVYHRLEIAGDPCALTWEEGTFDVLFKYSQGIPRLINIYCDFLLLAACMEGTTDVSLEFIEDVISDVAWDKHLTDCSEDPSQATTLARQSLQERLSVYEQKLAALEPLLSLRDEMNCELLAHKEILKEILEAHESGFHRMEESLERTCQHLQMYLTGFAAKEVEDLKNSDVENIEGHPDKGLLKKLFS